MTAMSDHSCCDRAVTGRAAGQVVGRRLGSTVRWAVPSAVLVLLPKCPMCIAAYLALWTGVTVSTSVAGGVRVGLIGACLACIFWMCFRQLRKLLAARRGA